MDEKSKSLDERYQGIWKAEREIVCRKEAAALLKNGGSPTGNASLILGDQEKKIAILERQVEEEKLELAADLLLLDDMEELAAVKLRYVDQLQWKEIADRMGCSRRRAINKRDAGLAKIANQKFAERFALVCTPLHLHGKPPYGIL